MSSEYEKTPELIITYNKDTLSIHIKSSLIRIVIIIYVIYINIFNLSTDIGVVLWFLVQMQMEVISAYRTQSIRIKSYFSYGSISRLASCASVFSSFPIRRALSTQRQCGSDKWIHKRQPDKEP